MTNPRKLVGELIPQLGEIFDPIANWSETPIPGIPGPTERGILSIATSTASAAELIEGINPHTLLCGVESYLDEHHPEQMNQLSRVLLTFIKRIIPRHTTEISPLPTSGRIKSPSTETTRRRAPKAGSEGPTPQPPKDKKSKETRKTPVRTDFQSKSVPHDVATSMTPTNIPFANLPHVKCKTEHCTYCLDLWGALPFSRCCDVLSHSAKPCTSSGWYKHVLPASWGKLSRDHRAGRAFQISKLSLPKPTSQQPPLDMDEDSCVSYASEDLSHVIDKFRSSSALVGESLDQTSDASSASPSRATIARTTTPRFHPYSTSSVDVMTPQ